MLSLASIASVHMLAMVLFYFIGILLTIYVIYDVVMEQERMQPTEKVLWIGVAIVLNLVGVLVYLAVIKYNDDLLLAEDSLKEIERLGELHEAGVLTDEEFEAEKGRILDERANRDQDEE